MQVGRIRGVALASEAPIRRIPRVAAIGWGAVPCIELLCWLCNRWNVDSLMPETTNARSRQSADKQRMILDSILVERWGLFIETVRAIADDGRNVEQKLLSIACSCWGISSARSRASCAMGRSGESCERIWIRRSHPPFLSAASTRS